MGRAHVCVYVSDFYERAYLALPRRMCVSGATASVCVCLLVPSDPSPLLACASDAFPPFPFCTGVVLFSLGTLLVAFSRYAW